MGLKLSDLHPDDVNPIEHSYSDDSKTGMKLSDLHPDDVAPVSTSDKTSNDLAMQQEPSLGEAIYRGTAKGLTGGLTGWAAGAGAAAGTYMGEKGLAPNWEHIKQAYQEALKAQNDKEQKAHDAHPVAGTISEVAGSIPTFMLGAGGLKAAGMASKGAQAATLGGATGLTSYMGSTADPSLMGAAGSTAAGAALGKLSLNKYAQAGMLGGGAAYLGSKYLGADDGTLPAAAGTLAGAGLALAAHKVPGSNFGAARLLGQAGETLFGDNASTAVKQQTEDLANSVISGIKNEKKRVGDLYESILDANKDKNIDLTDFVNKLKDRASNMDTSLPEQARDKKAIMDLVLKITEGPEVEKVTGFEPGSINTEKQTVGFEPNGPVKTQTTLKGYKSEGMVPEGPSAKEDLQQEGQRLIEQNKQLGHEANWNIVPSDDDKFLTRLLNVEKENGPVTTAKTVPNEPGTPAYTKISPVTMEEPLSTPIRPIKDDIPVSQDISPITKTVREGGTLTPDVPEAKKLRTNLGTFADENLSNAGQHLADSTYGDLTSTLKDQVPGLGDTNGIPGADSQYTALLKAAKKLGIKGNDEDVVRVLSKMTSDNQGKEIIVNQALDSLAKVNPELAQSIRDQNLKLDQKMDLIDKIKGIGDFDITNLKSIAKGSIKSFGGATAAAGNKLGLLENKYADSLPVKVIQRSSLPLSVSSSPSSQQPAQDVGKSIYNSFGEVFQKSADNNPSDSTPWSTKSSQVSNQPSATKTYATLDNATDGSIKNIANQMVQKPALKDLGNHLNKAVDSNDKWAKKQALFNIMQNKTARKMLTPGD